MPQRTLFILLILLVFVLAAGCADRNCSQKRSHWNLGSPQTFTDELTFEMREPFVNLTLAVDFCLEEGELAWFVINPERNLHNSGTLSGQESFKEKWTLEPVYGTWALVVKAERVAGRVHMDWEGTK